MAASRQVIPIAVASQVGPAPEVISQTELAMLLSLQGRLHQLATVKHGKQRRRL